MCRQSAPQTAVLREGDAAAVSSDGLEMDCGTDEGCRHPCTDPTSHALPPASVGAAPANDDVPDDDDGLLHESVKTRLDELATYLRPAGDT